MNFIKTKRRVRFTKQNIGYQQMDVLTRILTREGPKKPHGLEASHVLLPAVPVGASHTWALAQSPPTIEHHCKLPIVPIINIV